MRTLFVQATIDELRAQVVDLEQRVRVSEAKESELKAKLADVEQRVGTSDIIDELRAAAAASDAKSQVTRVPYDYSSGTDLVLKLCSCRPPSTSSGRRWSILNSV